VLLIVCCCLIRAYATQLAAIRVPSPRSSAKLALSLNLVYSFQDTLSLMVVLLDSGHIAQALDGNMAFSGWIIGMYKMGGAAGIGLFWVGLSICPELWRQGRSTLLVTSMLQFVGAGGVLLVGRGAASQQMDVINLQAFILMARFVQGFGGGIQQLLIQNQVGHLAPASDRHERQLSIYVAYSLGLGCAPLCASLFGTAGTLVQCQFGKNVVGYEAVMFLSVVFPLASSYCLAFYPDLSDAHDLMTLENSAIEGSQFTLRSIVVILCVVAIVGRVFALAVWEVALTFLLEIEYGLFSFHNALVISAMCFSTLIVRFFIDKFKHLGTVAMWIRILCFTSILGIVIARFQNMWMLIAASFLLYPMLYMTGGFFMGTLQNSCLPDGHFLDLKTTSLIASWGSELVGRGLAPATSRMGLSLGFSWWWAGELAVVIVGTFVSEVALRVQSLDDNQVATALEKVAEFDAIEEDTGECIKLLMPEAEHSNVVAGA